MKTNLKFVGIDVSKDSLDICLLSENNTSLSIKNTVKSINKYFTQLTKDDSCNYHICAENTGKYTWALMSVLSQMDCKFYIVNPLHLKRSMGLIRGKNDKIDAIRIAYFIKRNYQDITPFVPNSLPAMVKANRIQDKVAGVGFDWEEPHQVWEKVQE